MDRMRGAPARLLIDRASGVSVRLYSTIVAYFSRYCGLSPTPLEVIWGGRPPAVLRNSFIKRYDKEEDSFSGKLFTPDMFTAKEQLAISRANIRRRATKVRPRLKGG